MAVTTEQFTRLEDRVDEVSARANRLEGVYSQLATKADIAELRGATKADIAELRGATKADIAELRGEMKGIKIGLWIVGAVLLLPELLQRFGI